MGNNKKWEIFILSHEKIDNKMYEKDKYFNTDNYKVFNVNTKKNKQITNSENYSVISQTKFKTFEELGSNYAESEALWNFWKEGLHKGLDYVGFIHYDVDITISGQGQEKYGSLTKEISSYISDKDKAHISFLEFNTKDEWKKWKNPKILQPLKNGGKISYYKYILDAYNEFFGTNYTEKDFIKREKINLCSCFFIDTKTFDKMMQFFDYAIKNNQLSAFDTTKDLRLPGGLAERYFGTFLLFEYSQTKSIPLLHLGTTTNINYNGNHKTINLFGIKIKYKTKKIKTLN